MNRQPNESPKAITNRLLPVGGERRSGAIRKSRAARPSLETCEARTLLSASPLHKLIQPLQFSAVSVAKNGTQTQVVGTLNLTKGPGGGLTGSLVQADGAKLSVGGSLINQRINLTIHAASGQSIHAVGPVVSASLAKVNTAAAGSTPAAPSDGQITLHGGGLVMGSGGHSTGTFSIQGADVVLPAGHLQDPQSVPRTIAAGTTLVPTEFAGRVTHGPDAGTTLAGVLSLGEVARDGSFAGSLADQVHGAIPVSGRIVGQQIEVTFDLGAGGKVGGVGPFIAEKVGPGSVRITSFGSLQTGNPADSGDWAVTLQNSIYSNKDYSNQWAPSDFALYGNTFLTGTTFQGSTFSRVHQTIMTGSVVDKSCNFIDASFDDPLLVQTGQELAPDLHSTTFIGVSFTGAVLAGAKMYGVDLTGGSLAFANLQNADLSHSHLNGCSFTGATLFHTNFIGADLTGTGLSQASLEQTSCKYDSTTIF